MSNAPSPRLKARIAGFLYLVIMVAALFAEAGVRGAVIVSGNAAATAHNILASQQLYRLGGGADIVTLVCDVALAALFYDLLKPAGPSLALLAAFFRLAYSAIFGLAVIAHFAPLAVLTGEGFSAFTSPQLQAFAMLALKLHSVAYNVALVFFGVHCLLLGILIARSRFLPALIGVLLVIVGVCYLINSATHLVFTNYDFYPWILLPGLLGEGGLTLWLLLVGLNVAQWEARVSSA